MLSKIYIFLYLFFLIGVNYAPFAESEDKMDIIESNENEKVNFFNDKQANITSDPNSNEFEKIEESDFFEPEENQINNASAKEWEIKIKLGPFKNKDDAKKALNNIKIDSSDKLFGADTQSPILNLPEKFLSYKIIEINSSEEPAKKPSHELGSSAEKPSQVTLKNRSLIDIDDKTINRAHEEGVDWQEINRKYIQAFHENMEKLDITSSPEEPKAADRSDKKLLTPTDSKYMVEVVTAGMPLRVRESPVITSPIVYKVKNGTNYLSIEKPTLDETEKWVRIEYLKGEFGWISKTYSKITGFSESKLADNKKIQPKSKVAGEFDIAQFYNWIRAWENKEVEAYLSFYSENFKGYKENRFIWEASRRQALKKRLSMTIEAKNINIVRMEKKVKVSFIQIFQSDDYKDIGKKELEWEKAERGWKIVRETWSSL